MRLLAMTIKNLLLHLSSFFLMDFALADIKCNIGALTNPEIINCTQASYVKIDTSLNEQYQNLIAVLDIADKHDLQKTQRNWIALKINYCAEDHTKASFGMEGPIDEISCMSQFTSFRLNELIFLKTGVIGDGFYKAVSIVNEKLTTMDYSKAIEYVGGDMNFGALWEKYAQGNCAMTQKIHGEQSSRCMARMRFQMPIY